MTKKTYSPLIGRVTENDPVARFTVGLKQSTRIDLALYQAFYKEATGDAIERGQLIEELLKAVVSKDTQFGAWKKENPTAVKAATEEASAASKSDKDTAGQ